MAQSVVSPRARSILDRVRRRPRCYRLDGVVVEDRPVKDEVVLVALAEEQVLEQPAQVGVVGAVLEAQAAAVVQVRDELRREVLAQGLDGCRHLLLHDLLVLLRLRVRLEPLPGQAAAVEVHQHVPDSLQVVTPTLLDTQVCVHTRVARRTSQALALPVGDVLLRLRVTVLLGQAKVDYVDLVGLLAQADQKVVRLDIAVDEVLGMHVLHAVDHLICKHEGRLQAELAIAEAEEILQGRAQQVDDHHVVVALHAVPMDVGDADATCKNLVQLGLIQELRMPGLDGLQLDGDLLPGLHVGADVDVAEGSGANLP
eukprot:CAMPEP_0204094030 /NCGR_PEP_ID=MMETSP0360-20130528/190721_1 /ASSEMBLY_ACC=CAM_ASM_000342 /TAXON_ID=268821 /ORGANISM="Scrippsiella Hangoei, Strain SHTV-5" /LENGTH=312 /DNA_ID=CAMNT_0051043337 /DNA_START=633 /DNA_END=1567 /DNA_ORIENTATION=-